VRQIPLFQGYRDIKQQPGRNLPFIKDEKMTFIYCLLAFGGGFFFGVFAIALVVFSGDKEKRK